MYSKSQVLDSIQTRPFFYRVLVGTKKGLAAPDYLQASKFHVQVVVTQAPSHLTHLICHINPLDRPVCSMDTL